MKPQDGWVTVLEVLMELVIGTCIGVIVLVVLYLCLKAR